MTYTKKYEGFKWIGVPKFTYDNKASVELNYDNLLAHHIKEVEFLIREVRKLAKEMDDVILELNRPHKTTEQS